jgi:hypothetical protein
MDALSKLRTREEITSLRSRPGVAEANAANAATTSGEIREHSRQT